MCVSLAMAGIAAAGSIFSGFASAAATKAEAKSNEQQQREEMALAKIQASEAEVRRQEDMRHLQSANIASQAAAGFGSNRSFLEGVNKFNREIAIRDLTNIRFNQRQQDFRTELNIGTANAMAKSRAKNAIIGGFLQAGATAAGGYSDFKKIAVPGSQTTSTQGRRVRPSSGLPDVY